MKLQVSRSSRENYGKWCAVPLLTLLLSQTADAIRGNVLLSTTIWFEQVALRRLAESVAQWCASDTRCAKSTI